MFIDKRKDALDAYRVEEEDENNLTFSNRLFFLDSNENKLLWKDEFYIDFYMSLNVTNLQIIIHFLRIKT